MSSVDYRAYIQSEIEECKRMANVYQGVEADKTPPSEHIAVDHLDTLLSKGLPRDLLSLYKNEYDELRSVQRAIALGQMCRKDFYDAASQDIISEREYLSNKLAYDQYFTNQFLKESDADFKEELSDESTSYEQRKNESVDRLKAEGGQSSSSQFTDKDLVRVSMSKVPGVNTKGVATDAKVVKE